MAQNDAPQPGNIAVQSVSLDDLKSMVKNA